MGFSKDDLELLNRLVGSMDESDGIIMYRNIDCFLHPELLALLKCFMLEASEYECRNSDYLNQIALALTHLVVRSVFAGTCQTAMRYDWFEVDRAISYMNSHINEKITVEDLAAHANLSASHFAKIFKFVTGVTPIDFLKTMCLKKARNMIVGSDDNMTEIVLKCGFNTSSYFSSCFKLDRAFGRRR